MGAALITPHPPRVAGDSFSASSSVRRDAKHSVHSRQVEEPHRAILSRATARSTVLQQPSVWRRCLVLFSHYSKVMQLHVAYSTLFQGNTAGYITLFQGNAAGTYTGGGGE